MSLQPLEVIALLLGLAAVFASINDRLIHLPTTVAVMALGLVASLLLLAAGEAAAPIRRACAEFVGQLDFRHVLLGGMLAFLLFAGAIELDMRRLRGQWLPTFLLAVVATPISAALIGAMAYTLLAALGPRPSLIDCLLLGTVLSPTDPIAVLEMLKRIAAPRRLQTQLAGESLFNDGVAAVLFLTLLEANSGGNLSTARVFQLLAYQGGGGVVLGFLLGDLGAKMVGRTREPNLELLVTLALAAGSYALADRLGFSGVLAVICAGASMNYQKSRVGGRPWGEHVEIAWKLIDKTLNVLLFLLLGLEVLVLPLRWVHALAGVAAAGQVLIARIVSVAIVALVLRVVSRRNRMDGRDMTILSWAGLRGGLSVALGLALPAGPQYASQVPLVYGVVIFSILVQGMTVAPLITMLRPRDD